MRFHSKPIEEHVEVPLADEGQWEALVAKADRRLTRDARQDNRCYVVSVRRRDDDADPEAQLGEILSLVRAQGDEVVGHTCLELRDIDPRTYLGRGRSARIADAAEEAGANMVVLDAELSPSQLRNLEDVCGMAICDREAVILNVFLRHARTREARMQVEIAHLEYLRPRIRGLGLNMDQQAGGVMRARGPGETASELMARRLDKRLTDLKRAALKHTHARRQQRDRRARCRTVALVGYTNAGKTTLMNGLTDAGLSARDRPFETLATTSRSLCRRGTDVVLADTVGFIRRMPERLLASFASTLAEIRDATLLVMVLDASDPEIALHVATTERMLEQLEAADVPRLVVFNKVDRGALDAHAMRRLAGGHDHVALSGHDAEAVCALREDILDRARSDHRIARVFVPYERVGEVYGACAVLATHATPSGLRMTVEAPGHVIDGLQEMGRKHHA